MANIFFNAEDGTLGNTASVGFNVYSTYVKYQNQYVESGTLGYGVGNIGSLNGALEKWFANDTVVEVVGYYEFTAAPTEDVTFARIFSNNNTTIASLGLSSTGKLNFITASGAPQIPFQSTANVPINVPLRIAMWINTVTGECRAGLYNNQSGRALMDSGIRVVTGMAPAGQTPSGVGFMKISARPYAGSIYADSIRIKTGADATNTFAAEHPEEAPAVLTTFAPAFDHESFRAGVLLGVSPTTLRLAVSTSPEMTNSTYFNGDVNTTDWYGTAKATGLDPDTQYYYCWEVNGSLHIEETGKLYTTVAPGTPASFTFAAASCQKTGSEHPSLEHVATSGYRFFCHMGDLHYADAQTRTAMKAGFEVSMLSNRMKMLTKSTALQYCWDNHDRMIVGELNVGSTAPETINFWREFVGDDMPEDANYKTWVDGRVRFIHTDPWTQRDSEATAEPRTMFGDTQIQWIKDTLTNATEPVIVWFKSFPNHYTANGRWDSFPTEIAMWDAWIAAHPEIKKRLIMIGGDSHDIRADSGTRVQDVNGGPQHFRGVPDLNVSGLDQGNAVVDWDTTDYDLGIFATGLNGGAYSRCTVTDQGGSTITLKWEALRFTSDGTMDIPTSHVFAFPAESINAPLLTVYDQDGTEKEATLTIWDGTQEVVPLSLGIMPKGYDSLRQMTYQSPWLVAHRGGSSNWPECSLKAYTQSVAWGMPALELSLNVTSDGVMFGLHDPTLDRTSSNATGGVNPQTMTWETLQANYKIDQQGIHVPYMRAEEVLDLYSDSHVFFIDPKSMNASATLLNNMFDMLKDFPGWEKMVIKYAGGGISVATAARAAGFKTWGFWYDTPTDLTSLANANSYWDYLGMDYTGSQSAWDQVISYGKPVVGHIIPSVSAYQQVLTKGATATSLGVMVSGVKSVLGTPKVFQTP